MFFHTAHVSSLPVALLFLLSFLHSFPCPLLIFSAHTAYQCGYHSVTFQPTASGFTWLSLAGLLYCSRSWLLTGIYTLLGPWLVNVSAQTVCTLLVPFCRSSRSLESSLSQGQRLCLFSNTEASAQEGNVKVTWKK